MLKCLRERLHCLTCHDAYLLLYCVTLWPYLNFCTCMLRTSPCFLSSSLKIYDDELRATVCSSCNPTGWKWPLLDTIHFACASWWAWNSECCAAGTFCLLGFSCCLLRTCSPNSASKSASKYATTPAQLCGWGSCCMVPRVSRTTPHCMMLLPISEDMGYNQSIFYCRYTIYRLIWSNAQGSFPCSIL